MIKWHEQPAGMSFCLPAVSRSHRREMRFLRFRRGAHLVTNRFGIGEPITRGGPIVPAADIDLALMPVVGFDESGSRIGMGAGYYDRFFGRKGARGYRHARLVGIAFECQKLPGIERREWDVPLDLVVTEKAVYRTDATDDKNPTTSR